MDKMPPKADADEGLRELTERLLNVDYQAVVVFEDDAPIGLITLKDIMRWLVHTRGGENWKAGDLVSVPLISIDINDPLQRALDLMEKHKISYVGVMEDTKLRGLLYERNVKEICSLYPHYLLDKS